MDTADETRRPASRRRPPAWAPPPPPPPVGARLDWPDRFAGSTARQVPQRRPETPVPNGRPGGPHPASLPVQARPAAQRAQQARPSGQRWIRKQRTWPQLAGGILIAAAFAAAVVWYVPRVMNADREVLTGTVTSGGVVTLNFAGSGDISKINVHLGQTVRKGQVLAAEYAPDLYSVIAADKAAIASDQTKISELKAVEAADPAQAGADDAQLAADNAQLAADEAELAMERMKAAATEIIAPSAGVVIAANGQPGEAVTSSGIRDYATYSGQASTIQSPQFSLLPEGPQSVRKAAASTSALPVIALRTSATWQVVALVPEDSVSRVEPGQDVTVIVPAARIAGVRGRIEEVLPTPESTAQGTYYQAVVSITGQTAGSAMNGMAADIRLAS